MQETNPKMTSLFPALRLSLARQMADYQKRLADRMEKERTDRSLSRETLALRAGVSVRTIRRIENQQTVAPRPVTIRRLAEAMNLDPAVFQPEREKEQLDRMEELLIRVVNQLEARDVLRDLDGAAPTHDQERQPDDEEEDEDTQADSDSSPPGG